MKNSNTLIVRDVLKDPNRKYNKSYNYWSKTVLLIYSVVIRVPFIIDMQRNDPKQRNYYGYTEST